MMTLEAIKRVYFVGIGGIGMSSLARFFMSRGCQIAGYDKTQTPLTDQLSQEGMQISYVDQPATVPAIFRKKAEDQMVVYTPSVPPTSALLTFFKNTGVELYKRSAVLGIISQQHKVLAIAGTHGKTSTSTLLAHLLKYAGIEVLAFLGGISVNYKSNFISGNSAWAVMEADEYDRSFLSLFPYAAVITAMDPDHLDVYGSAKNMEAAYNQFASQVAPNGFLLAQKGLPVSRNFTSYSASESADVYASNVRILNGSYYFDYHDQHYRINDIRLETPGMHSVENATAAIRLAMEIPIAPEKIKEGIESFRGVKRRFEYFIKTDKHVLIDDYAHHPEELAALIATVKALYPSKRMTLIFQPHLFSRTRDFCEELADVLSLADESIVMPIYPAREMPIEGVTSSMILKRMGISEEWLKSPHEILSYVTMTRPELLVCAGAGDIDTLLQPIKEILENDSRKNVLTAS